MLYIPPQIATTSLHQQRKAPCPSLHLILFSCSWTLRRWEWNISLIQRWKFSLWNELPQNIPAKDMQTLWRYFTWGFRSRICKSPGSLLFNRSLFATLHTSAARNFVNPSSPQFSYAGGTRSLNSSQHGRVSLGTQTYLSIWAKRLLKPQERPNYEGKLSLERTQQSLKKRGGELCVSSAVWENSLNC